MTSDSEEKLSDLMIHEFQKNILAIESLSEFLQNSLDNIEQMKRETEEKYEIGLYISRKLREIPKMESKEEAIKRVETIGDDILPDGKKMSDYIDVKLKKENDEIKGFYFVNKTNTLQAKYIDPKEAEMAYEKIYQYNTILTTSTLSNIVIFFEQYLANMYRYLIFRNPRKYLQNKKIEVARIFDRSMKDIIFECVNNEVEKTMFDTMKALKDLSEEEHLNINRYENILDEFEEIYYRRNLYIHNDGVVNSLYLSNVKEQFRRGIKIKDELETDDVYLKKAINMLYKVIGALFYEIQVQFDDRCKEWNDVFNDIAFKLLCRKNYDVAEHYYNMLSRCKKFSFKDKAIARIDYIVALKQQGREKNVAKELKDLDVSIATDEFTIAKMCLEDRHEEVYNALNKNYPNPYPAEFVRDWPIFIDFRKTEFYARFVEEHAEDMNTIEAAFSDMENA